MTTSLRIMALLLGLLGLERVIYADIVAVLPRLPEPTPVLNTVMGLSILIVAVGLYVGFGWSRWPGIIGAALVGLQGIAWVAWTLGQGFEPVAVIYGLFEPLLAVLDVPAPMLQYHPVGFAVNPCTTTMPTWPRAPDPRAENGSAPGPSAGFSYAVTSVPASTA